MRHQALLIAAAFALCACGQPEPPPKPLPLAEPAGRVETQGIRNTEAIGMGGAAIADQLDQALKQNEDRKAGLDQQLEQAENPP